MIVHAWKPVWSESLINHLWQTSLVVLVAWLLTLFLKRNAAQTRYRIWMAASLKFLLPFSLLSALGDWLRPAHVALPPLADTAWRLTYPYTSNASPVVQASPAGA